MLSRQPGGTLRTLRFKWALLAGGCAVMLAGGAIILQPHLSLLTLMLGTALSGSGLLYFLTVVRRHLDANRRSDSTPLLPHLGLPTLLTLSRGILVSLLLGFLAAPRPGMWLDWLPAALYGLAMLTDFLDGYLARVTDRVTELGAILDLKLDGLGVLAATLVAVRAGQVPAIYLLVGFARYLFVFGIWIRRRTGQTVYPLPPSVRRRVFAGVQMGFIGVMLMPLFSPPGTHLAAWVFMVGFLAGFLVDWFYVCGWRLPELPGGATLWPRFHGSLAVILRLFSAVALAFLGIAPLSLEVAGSARPEIFAALFGVGWVPVVLALALALGVAGRLASLGALFWLGFVQLRQPLSPLQMALVVSTAGVFFLGTGPASLWRPENRLIYRRAGDPV